MTTHKATLDFLRFCVTNSEEAPVSINQISWQQLYDFAKYFPAECLYEPIFRVYHYGWRIWMNHIKR